MAVRLSIASPATSNSSRQRRSRAIGITDGDGRTPLASTATGFVEQGNAGRDLAG
jgi:hypothetical protein